jgi:hypothetical protein
VIDFCDLLCDACLFKVTSPSVPDDGIRLCDRCLKKWRRWSAATVEEHAEKHERLLEGKKP